MDKTFSYLEAQYSKNLKEFRETELKRVAEEYDRNMLDTIDELEKKFEVKLREQEDKYLAQVICRRLHILMTQSFIALSIRNFEVVKNEVLVTTKNEEPCYITRHFY